MSDSPPQHPDDEDPGFFARFKGPIIAVALIGVGAGAYFMFFAKAEKPKKKAPTTTMVMPILPPPPPPPTPPPTPPPPQPEQQKIEDKREDFVEETKPEEAAPEPQAAPEEAAPMGSNIQGEGSDAFGLRGKGGGGMIGGLGSGKGGGGGSEYGFYAGQVQSVVADALRAHKKTRSASLKLQARIWVDSTGRITKATLSGSSGDPTIDNAIRDEILAGLQLRSPPPEGMPMPIVMRFTAARPN